MANEPMFEWSWWVVRDDGDRCGGPHATREAAEEQLRALFDVSEYRVDHQYLPIGTGLDGE